MATKVRVQIGKAWVEVEGANPKEIVQGLSPYYDLFREVVCGLCASENIGLEHRQAQDFDYYSLKCFACGGQLSFGQKRDQDTLFPKRKLENGEYDKQHHGWHHWKDRRPGNQPPSQVKDDFDGGF